MTQYKHPISRQSLSTNMVSEPDLSAVLTLGFAAPLLAVALAATTFFCAALSGRHHHYSACTMPPPKLPYAERWEPEPWGHVATSKLP
jgi:hypothetical protein